MPGECGVIIEAYRLGISLVLDSNANREVGALIKQFETLKQVLKEVQTGVNEVASGMRGLSRIGNSAAESWRSAARAMQDAARAARAAGSAMPNGRRAAAAASGGGEASERPISPGPRVPAALLTYEGSRALMPYRGDGRDLVPYTSRETGFSTRGDPYGPGTSLVPAGPRSEFGERTYARSPTWGALAPFVDRGPGSGFRMNGESYIPDSGSRAVGGYGGGPRGPIDLNYDPDLLSPPGRRPRDRRAGSGQNWHHDAVQMAIPAYGGYEALKKIYEADLPVEELKAKLLLQGFSKEEVGQAYLQSVQTQRSVRGSSVGGNLEVISDLMTVTQDKQAALGLMQDFAKMSVILDSTGHSGEGKGLMDAIRAGEFRGVLTHFNQQTGKDEIDAKGLDAFLKNIVATNIASGGSIGASQIRQFLLSSGVAGALLSDRSAFADSMAVITAMGPGRAGRALQGFGQQFTAGRMSEAGANMLLEMGIIQGGGTAKHNPFLVKAGMGQFRMKPGAMPPGMFEEASSETAPFILEYILPKIQEYLKKNYGKRYTDADEIGKLRYETATAEQLASRIPGGTEMSEVIRNHLIIERDRSSQAAALNRDAYDIATKNNPDIQLKGFNASFNAFLISLSESGLMQKATAGLDALTKVLDQFSKWAAAHPKDASDMLTALAVAVGAFAVGSVAAMAIGVLTGAGGFIALAGGIEALGHALTSFPKWMIDMAAGAGAGAMVGGLPGAVIGAAGGVVVGQVARHPKGTLKILEGLTDGSDSPFGLSPSGSVTVGGTHINPWATDNAGSTVRPFGASSSGGGASGTAADPLHVKVVNPGDVANGVTKNAAKSIARPQTGVTGFDPSMGAPLSAIPGGF